MLNGKWPVQANLYQSNLFPPGSQMVYNLFNCFAGRSHGNNYSFRVRNSHIIKQLISAAGQIADLFHICADNCRNFQVIRIRYLHTLEIDVRVLSRTTDFRSFRAHSSIAEGFNGIPVYQFSHIIIVDYFHLLNFVGSTEPVKEV